MRGQANASSFHSSYLNNTDDHAEQNANDQLARPGSQAIHQSELIVGSWVVDPTTAPACKPYG